MSRVGSPSPASEEQEPEARPRERSSLAVKVVIGVGFLVIFLTVGVPRFFAGDDSSVRSNGSVDVSKLCRQHGGTPSKGTASAGQPVCTVTYGGEVYRMDAITSRGFDVDTAAFQKQGCDEARRQQQADGAGAPQRTFVYHADTGVCEHRP
jgi:hypothetical protein